MENDDNGQSCGLYWSPIGSDSWGSAEIVHLQNLQFLNSMIFLRKNHIQGCIHPIPNIKTPGF